MTDGKLDRFVQAQEDGDTYRRALRELRQGRKRTPWMWFVFPQLAGLGHSPTARFYALSGPGEARDYLGHPLLGARLRECVGELERLEGDDAVAVLGEVDALKLRSCLTLFAQVAPGEPLFERVLRRFFGGPDTRTLQLLEGTGPA